MGVWGEGLDVGLKAVQRGGGPEEAGPPQEDAPQGEKEKGGQKGEGPGVLFHADALLVLSLTIAYHTVPKTA